VRTDIQRVWEKKLWEYVNLRNWMKQTNGENDNGELHNFYPSHNIFRVIKWNRTELWDVPTHPHTREVRNILNAEVEESWPRSPIKCLYMQIEGPFRVGQRSAKDCKCLFKKVEEPSVTHHLEDLDADGWTMLKLVLTKFGVRCALGATASGRGTVVGPNGYEPFRFHLD
jgi:hypothetical protein